MSTLIIAGNGPYLETIKIKSESLSNIHILGEIKRNDLADLYSECDLFIFQVKPIHLVW